MSIFLVEIYCLIQLRYIFFYNIKLRVARTSYNYANLRKDSSFRVMVKITLLHFTKRLSDMSEYFFIANYNDTTHLITNRPVLSTRSIGLQSPIAAE